LVKPDTSDLIYSLYTTINIKWHIWRTETETQWWWCWQSQQVELNVRSGGVAQWLRVGLDQRSYHTPGPVSTWMGDRLWAGKPSWYVTSHLGQLSLPSLRVRQIEYQPSMAGVKAGVCSLVSGGR